tara:strand:+ start:91 stop:303 length:213 start_codon:yes stop_codon:yes gene_type:complete
LITKDDSAIAALSASTVIALRNLSAHNVKSADFNMKKAQQLAIHVRSVFNKIYALKMCVKPACQGDFKKT